MDFIATLNLMKKYDAIVVLGSQPDFRNWMFPSHPYISLDRALELLNEGVAPYICLSGDHALKYDNTGITQPFKECDKEEEYLLSRGCPPEVILKEGESRDTISNFYYLKNLVFKPRNIRHILVVTTDFRTKRIAFLCQKVLGPDYQIGFETVEYKSEEVYKNEVHTLKVQSKFLKEMKDGDDAWLKGKFYDAPMYKYWEARDLAETDPIKRFLI
jgi:uncharacterized SAM-binding protein YcdF (DUF218 family)